MEQGAQVNPAFDTLEKMMDVLSVTQIIAVEGR